MSSHGAQHCSQGCSNLNYIGISRELTFVSVTVTFLHPHLENRQRKETKTAEEKARTGRIWISLKLFSLVS